MGPDTDVSSGEPVGSVVVPVPLDPCRREAHVLCDRGGAEGRETEFAGPLLRPVGHARVDRAALPEVGSGLVRDPSCWDMRHGIMFRDWGCTVSWLAAGGAAARSVEPR